MTGRPSFTRRKPDGETHIPFRKPTVAIFMGAVSPAIAEPIRPVGDERQLLVRSNSGEVEDRQASRWIFAGVRSSRERLG